jgi:hypothetical protein
MRTVITAGIILPKDKFRHGCIYLEKGLRHTSIATPSSKCGEAVEET